MTSPASLLVGSACRAIPLHTGAGAKQAFYGRASHPDQVIVHRPRHHTTWPVDVVPALVSGHGGTAVVTSAFGGRTQRANNGQWHIDPIARRPNDAFKLNAPNDSRTGLLAKGLAIAHETEALIDIPPAGR